MVSRKKKTCIRKNSSYFVHSKFGSNIFAQIFKKFLTMRVWFCDLTLFLQSLIDSWKKRFRFLAFHWFWVNFSLMTIFVDAPKNCCSSQDCFKTNFHSTLKQSLSTISKLQHIWDNFVKKNETRKYVDNFCSHLVISIVHNCFQCFSTMFFLLPAQSSCTKMFLRSARSFSTITFLHSAQTFSTVLNSVRAFLSWSALSLKGRILASFRSYLMIFGVDIG